MRQTSIAVLTAVVLFPFAAVVLFPFAAAAQDPAVFRCGTSSETSDFVRELGEWSQARARTMIAGAAVQSPPASVRDGIYVLPADDINSPWHHAVDLEGRTLSFLRRSDTAFEVSNGELQYDETTGAELVLNGGSGYDAYALVTLPFAFPFFDGTLSKVYISDNMGIFSEAPLPITIKQFAQQDVVTRRSAVIAPLFSSPYTRFGPRPTVHLSTTPTNVTVTWTMSQGVDVQAVLLSNGDIRFSYRRVSTDALGAGTVIVSSGHEPWRTNVATLAASDDAENDTYNNTPAEEAPMLDMTGASIERVADTDLFEIHVKTRAPIVRSSIPSGESVGFLVFFDTPTTTSQYISYTITPTGDRYEVPGWPASTATGAARIEGNEVILNVMRENMVAAGETGAIQIYSMYNSHGADETAPIPVTLSRGSRPARADLSRASGQLFDGQPIAEAFTLAILNPAGVWAQLKQSDPALRDDAIDGVAIYQNFKTDIVTYASAYSTGGNSGAIGLAAGDTKHATQARTPNLMHMNMVAFNVNTTDLNAGEVVMHEFGHRWLFKVATMENGAVSHILNPSSQHPAQYVDTRAAFNVVTSTDSSVMGGGYFTEPKKGSFNSAPISYYGYSWLDLYLMGFAAASEVRPFFYIRNSNPALGSAYFPPFGQTFKGTRADMTIDDVVSATGPRTPAYPDTQRTFKVLFVLVVDPDRPVRDDEVADVVRYRQGLEKNFPIATGHRASVSTEAAALPAPPESGPRRRAIKP